MVEEVHPQLLRAVQKRDLERQAWIRFQRIALRAATPEHAIAEPGPPIYDG